MFLVSAEDEQRLYGFIGTEPLGPFGSHPLAAGPWRDRRGSRPRGGCGVRKSPLHFLGNRLALKLHRIFAHAPHPDTFLKNLEPEGAVGPIDFVLN